MYVTIRSGNGFGMKATLPANIPRIAPSWILVSDAKRVAGTTPITGNGDGNPTDAIFQDRIRNGRVVFAGDSIVRNQWESMLCMLAQGVSNQSTIYEVNGSPITKHRGFLSMRFEEYNLTVEYYRVPFMVMLDRPPQNATTEVRGAIKLDKLHWYCDKWVGADVLVFSPSHWWNEDKTTKLGNYFQQGGTMNMTMDVKEAFGRSVNTLMSWIMQNLNPEQSHVFYRSYSPVHYRQVQSSY
ncbi:OLC1v1034136C1 [Oldenlandia corymbosa var. corymbosa]|uniref:OLC1v1034136C1 n=1 Tax=Oldenlandia corymbosa var. corymbosa TaxID=529605 RepID=A0AAV1CSP9_OLDCO|nr:OLC1v1034136C1 [Oldenlandia corymbosa var. corymbosa]